MFWDTSPAPNTPTRIKVIGTSSQYCRLKKRRLGRIGKETTFLDHRRERVYRRSRQGEWRGVHQPNRATRQLWVSFQIGRVLVQFGRRVSNSPPHGPPVGRLG